MNRQANVHILVFSVLTIVVAFGSLHPIASGQVGQNMGLLNPNTVVEGELLSVPSLTPPIVEGIMERRPFLSMEAFDTYLGQSLSEAERTELYDRIFVPIHFLVNIG